MKNIRGKDTRIEVILRKALWNKRLSVSEKLQKVTWKSRYCVDKI
ncbi:MAG: hypothetical protein ACLTER_01150 [Ruminococcus sp.]